MAKSKNPAADAALAANNNGDTVVIGCKLPHGLRLKVGDTTRVLRGSNTSRIINGYGLTRLPRDFFEAWLKVHKNYVPVVRGLIFYQDNLKDAQSQAKEQQELRTGLEGLDAKTPIPGAKGITKANGPGDGELEPDPENESTGSDNEEEEEAE